MAWFFLSHLAAAALTLISFLVMTRVLSPEDFGVFNVIVLSATTAYFFALAWVPNSVYRFHSASEFAGKASAQAFGAGTGIILVALPAFAIALFVLPQAWLVPFLLGALFWTVHAMNEAGLSGLRVLGEGRRFAAAVVLRPLMGTALAISLALAGFGYAGAVVGMAVGAGATGVFVSLFTLRRLGVARPTPEAMRAFLGFGLPLAFVASSSTVVVLISQTFLAHGPGLAAVGIFAAAQTLALRGITMPMSMLSSAVSASIFHAYEVDGDAAADAALARHFSFLMLVGLPIAGVMALANDTVTNFLFDSPFQEEVARHLPVLAVAAFISGVQGAFYDYPFMIARRTHVQLLLSATAVATHALVSLALIRAFGLAGASWAFMASSVFALLLYRGVGRRFRVLHLPWAEVRQAAVAFLAFAPVALLADLLEHPVLSPLVAALAGVAFVIVLAAQGQIAMTLIAVRLARRFRRGAGS